MSYCLKWLWFISVSIHIDPSPSVRHLCGGNILAIEKLLAFGKELQIMNKELANELAKERRSNEDNDKIMRVTIFNNFKGLLQGQGVPFATSKKYENVPFRSKLHMCCQ